jgi:hypothetical protein
MDMGILLGLTAVIVALAAGGCSSGFAGNLSGSTATSSQPGDDVALTSYRGHGIVFAYPLAWTHRRPGYMSPETQGFVDLSTQPIVDPCHTSGNITTCGWPLRHLRPGGVVVTWTADYMPGLSIHRPPTGVHAKISRPGYCRTFDATETVTARLVTARHGIFLVNACLRGPGIASEERAVRTMLASAHTA